jgi:uncharacterized membrane protein
MNTTTVRSQRLLLNDLPGAVLGLFVARLALELGGRPWPGFFVNALVIILIGLGVWGGFALARRVAIGPLAVFVSWRTLPLLVYVVWPYRALEVAGAVAALVALLWWGPSVLSALRSREGLMDGAVFVGALIAYGVTSAPGLLPADAGEFQLAATLLGVPHPPGFPLYTMVAHLFVRLLPWGAPAYRLNLFSALVSATTLLVLSRATRQWARRLGASGRLVAASGIISPLTLGTAVTFWAQSTTASKRPFTAFFLALVLYFLSRFAAADNEQEAKRPLALLALSLSLGLGHHPPLIFLTPFFVAYLLLIDPRLALQPRRWLRPALAGLAGLAPLAYLPIRGGMGAPLAPDNLNTLTGFLHHFLALGFRGDMFAFATLQDLPHRLALLPTLYPFQFNLVLLALALVGFVAMARRDYKLFILLCGSFLLHTFISITYRAPQTVEYLIPAYLPLAIAVGLAPALAAGPTRRHWPRLLTALALWGGLLNGWAHAPSFVELADDYTARQTVEPLLTSAPADSRILADWRWATPLLYLQEVEGLRPDVDVRYVYPVAGQDYADVWWQRIQEAPPDQPVLLTHFFEFDDCVIEPWESGFLARPYPVDTAQAPLMPPSTVFGGAIDLLGHRLTGETIQPGQTLEFVLAWRASTIQPALPSAPSFTLRLVDAEGRQWAQADRRLVEAERGDASVHFARVVLPLYPTLPPGEYRATLGAYVQTAAGFEDLLPEGGDGETRVTLTELEIAPSEQRPFTLRRRSLAFENGPTLVGVDYDRGAPDVLRVYLHWRGAIPPGWQVHLDAVPGAAGVAPLPAIPAGAYQTVSVDLVGVGWAPFRLTVTDETGAPVRAAGPWGWRSTGGWLLPAPLDARFAPLGDEMVVVGADARPARPGETMTVDVTLLALRPLSIDIATSVRLLGPDGQWLDAHDCQPGLGAVPTLKWIRGSRVVDRRLLHIPPEFAGREVRAVFLAYENFRMTPLPSMDERFDQTPLGSWSLP